MVEEKNNELIVLKYSYKAKLVLVGMPIALYILTAMITRDFSVSINLNSYRVDDLASALGLFLVRLGAIVMFCLGVYKVFFTIPSKEAAGWMVI